MGCDMVVSRYAIPISIACVDGLSMGPPGFGASQYKNSIYMCNAPSREGVWYV